MAAPKPPFNGVWSNSRTRDFDSLSGGAEPPTPSNQKKKGANMNLVDVIKAIEQKQIELGYEFEEKIEAYEEALVALRNLNTVCEKCNGEGTRWKRMCAEDEGGKWRCELRQ